MMKRINRLGRRMGLALTAATVATLCAVSGVAPGHADPSDGPPPPDIVAGSGLRAAQQRQADDLTKELGSKQTGGAYVSDAGEVVVTVTDRSDSAVVEDQQAEAKVVSYSSADLQRVQQRLDRFAERHGAGEVQNWYVDVPENAIILTVDDSAKDAKTRSFVEKARTFGSRVEIVNSTGEVRPAAYLYDAQAVDLTGGTVCSVGFNAKTERGESIFITAGHCAWGGGVAWHRNNRIGELKSYDYPGRDYAAMTIDNPGYWNPQGAVDKFDGSARAVLGHAKPPVGARVCKSGRSSGWSCGVIQAYNQTVNYGNGELVYGLVRFNACAEPGDSGGPIMWGNEAVGIISGAQFFRSGWSTVCGERVGRENVSFLQPIGPVLDALDARLVTYKQ